MDYIEIKRIAKESGMRVNELLALSPGNDPFYTGRPSEIAMAQWFLCQWQAMNYTTGVHLRRMHYALVSQDPPIARHDGHQYANTQNCWDYLCNAGKYARYLDLVSPDSFVDRRNPDAIVNADLWATWPSVGISVTGDSDYDVELALPEPPDAPGFDLRGLIDYGNDGQPYMVELWAEKSTMNDVLEPLAREYKINLVTGLGELSITAVREFLRRAKQKGRPVRILYIADFDPAGIGMPISVARKIEFFLANDYQGLDIRLQPVVLTADQIARYRLPRVPVKDTDKRKVSFELAHGQGQVELDALEALYPGELANILRLHILDYYDESLADRLQDTHDATRQELDNMRFAVLESHPEIDVLQEQWAELTERFQQEIEHLQNEIAVQWAIIGSELGEELASYEKPGVPQAEDLQDNNGKLYQSDRLYFEQLRHYQDHREGR